VTVVDRQPVTPWMTKREAAAYARVSVSTISKAMHCGALRYSGGGGTVVLLRQEWVDAWLEGRAPTERGEA